MSDPKQRRIARRSLLNGALDWQLTAVRLERDAVRCPWIEGYCSHQSIEAGQTLRIMASTAPAARPSVPAATAGRSSRQPKRPGNKNSPLPSRERGRG